MEYVPSILGALSPFGVLTSLCDLRTLAGGRVPSPLLSPGLLSPSADHVSVSVELRFGAILIATAPLSFYDCVAVAELRPSAQ